MPACHSVFFSGQTLFLMPSQHCQSTEGNSSRIEGQFNEHCVWTKFAKCWNWTWHVTRRWTWKTRVPAMFSITATAAHARYSRPTPASVCRSPTDLCTRPWLCAWNEILWRPSAVMHNCRPREFWKNSISGVVTSWKCLPAISENGRGKPKGPKGVTVLIPSENSKIGLNNWCRICC